MIRGHIVRDGGATRIPREFADQADVDALVASGLHVELEQDLAPADPPADPAAAAEPVKAKKAAPAKKARK